MLDLQILEKKLDQTLANETKQSLRYWLGEKRLNNYIQSLGEGTLENGQEMFSEEVDAYKDTIPFNSEFLDIPADSEFLLAA